MKRTPLLSAFAVVSLTLLLTLCFAGCAGEPPAGSDVVLTNLRVGFNDEDVDQYCENFSEAVFGMGHTKGDYLGEIREYKRELGEWLTEKYKGNKENNYSWRVRFQYGELDLKLVFDDKMQIAGIYWYAVK